MGLLRKYKNIVHVVLYAKTVIIVRIQANVKQYLLKSCLLIMTDFIAGKTLIIVDEIFP